MINPGPSGSTGCSRIEFKFNSRWVFLVCEMVMFGCGRMTDIGPSLFQQIRSVRGKVFYNIQQMIPCYGVFSR